MRILSLVYTGAACLIALPAAAFQLESAVKHIYAFKALQDRLNPNGNSLADQCEGRIVADYATEAGQMVYDAGWVVQSEIPMGELTVVSFAGALRPLAGAPCAAENAHIGIFRGRSLLGFFLTEPTGAHADGSPLEQAGTLEQIAPDVIRVHASAPYLSPFADLQIDADRARLTEIDGVTTVCGDRQVPNIYGRPVLEARATLAEAGWQPMPEPEVNSDAAPFFAAHGIIEVATCSGTGMGYCGFSYGDSAGNSLTVQTGGDKPEYGPVIYFEAACAG